MEDGFSAAREVGTTTPGGLSKPVTPDGMDSSGKQRFEVEGLIREVHGEAHPDDAHSPEC